MGKSAPKPPNPMKTAQAQAQFSKEAAQDQLKMNSLGKTGPFGSSQFQFNADGMPTGINTSLSPELQPAAGNVTGAVGEQTAGLPAGVNFDMTTPEAIAQGNMGAYSALTAPQRQQQQEATNVMLSERGIPLGSEIDTNVRGNQDRQFAIADQNAAAQAWNAVPGMQSLMTNTAIAQGQAPGELAKQSLGLLGGLKGLTPEAQQPQAGVSAPNYSQLVQDNYRAQVDQYNANQQGLGNVLKTAAGLALTPMTGGFSNTLLGGALGGLFNGARSDGFTI